MNTRECMLKNVMQINFSLYDLALYLDTHPFDEEALCMYDELREKSVRAVNEYEEAYGPLTMDYATGECSWRWIENPWPWERMV